MPGSAPKQERKSSTPEDRAHYDSRSAVAAKPVAKYNEEDRVWLDLGKRGYFEVVIIAVQRNEAQARFEYQLEQDGYLYNGGEWVAQDKLNDC
ncbi:hypothetical protein GLAREA_09346 [Glarea lozoyensis ATCC 20868]|uniref:Uncharacterized protein n=1 Tax=Glarea lozoyensis (strain ATCC 20868 / MF5171) TaxID=1116229 RepID=S3D897_GLAL2|nr:uncharacterized protein GLAREA_09346 [Glarea lozoyensis ATCC 20868]EPE28226.1 hypothetical protein GLAREA_09346 [Glarea lozoyensis ATCC 20868]